VKICGITSRADAEAAVAAGADAIGIVCAAIKKKKKIPEKIRKKKKKKISQNKTK
jgi:phosphoribosylanthranilate isomerase